jgi:hypothetical protein
MRDEFREIISGWTLVEDVDVVGERIELAAQWERTNGPLEPDEYATVQLMIKTQIAWGIRRGDFEPFIPRDVDVDDVLNYDIKLTP